MADQRRNEVRPPVTEERSPDVAAPSANKRLRELDRTMAKLNRQQEKLNAALLATTDREDATELGRELHGVRSELEAAELEWLELATS